MLTAEPSNAALRLNYTVVGVVDTDPVYARFNRKGAITILRILEIFSSLFSFKRTVKSVDFTHHLKVFADQTICAVLQMPPEYGL